MLPNKILNKINSSGLENQFKDEDVLVWYRHILMSKYGWIPLEEYKKMPLTEIIGLLDCISTENKLQEKQMKKSSRKR